MAEAASRTPKVNAAQSFCFRIIVIGGMGTGKSTFTKALCGNQTALAGVSEDGGGVTTTISSYPVKAEICKKLGVPQACVLDVPGTGDPNLPVAKLITQLEEALSAVELHAILLMNPAGDARINIATRIGTALLDKSFIESADQIVGVLTKADKERKRSREKAREVWGTALEGTFNHKIPVVMCSVPVMDEEPYDVLEPEQYEEYEYDPNRAPGMDEVLQSLKKIAAHPEVAKYKQAGNEILMEVAQIVGVDVDDLQQQIKELEEERKKFALAQEELRKKLQKAEDNARREMLQMKRETELKDLYQAIKSRCESEEDAIIARARNEYHAVRLFGEECAIAVQRFITETSKMLDSNSKDVQRTQQAFVQQNAKAFRKKYNTKMKLKAEKREQDAKIERMRQEYAKQDAKFERMRQESAKQDAKFERMRQKQEATIHRMQRTNVVARNVQQNCEDYVRITRSKTTLYDGSEHFWAKDEIYRVVSSDNVESFHVQIVVTKDGKEPNVQKVKTFPLIELVDEDMVWDSIFETFSSEENRDRLTTWSKTVYESDLWMSKEDVGEIVANRVYVVREYNPRKLCVFLEDSLTNERVRFSVRENIRDGKEVLEPLEQVTKEEVKGSIGKIFLGLGLGVLGGGAIALSAPITATAGAVASVSAFGASVAATLGLFGGEIIDQANAETEYKKK